MLEITIVICLFIFFTIALILKSIENKYIIADGLIEILENLNMRTEKLENKIEEHKI